MEEFTMIDIEQSKLEHCHKLLKDILQDGFHIDCNLIESENVGDGSFMDRGMRNLMWKGFSERPQPVELMADFFSKNNCYVIRSNLGFYNVAFSILISKKSYILAVGPFRNEDISPSYFEQIMRDAGISQLQMTNVTNIYRSMPIADVVAITLISNRTVSEFFPDFYEIEPQSINFTTEKRDIKIDEEIALAQMAQYTENAKELLNHYTAALQEGNSTEARNAMRDYLNFTKINQWEQLSSKKYEIQFINNFSLAAILNTDVHPMHLRRLFLQMETAINEAVDSVKLTYISYDICHKYCLLVKNYSHNAYSKSIKDVMNYIQFHLDEELTLNSIAENFHRNPSTLSTLFHKETDTTLTQYIKEERVRKAIQLLNSTEKPISEIAGLVGYEDFAYFSRVFKQITHISPREYRKFSKS